MKILKNFVFCLVFIFGCSSDDSGGNITNPSPPPTESAFNCVDGLADIYPCNNYDLKSRVSLQDLGVTLVNDLWGWYDQDNQKEYALVGTNSGTAFVDVTDPEKPVLVGTLPTATVNSTWRDIKVYMDHAFIVSEASGHGMQVFDLKRLNNVTNPPETFTADARYTEFGNAHNIIINESSGFAYAVGTSTFNRGPHFINIQTPTSPIAAGGFSGDGESHDAQVVTYDGPDSDYNGKEILIGSNVDKVSIVDVTDKANPVSIATLVYPNVSIAHQGWFTQDKRYFILGDEGDESNESFKTHTYVFDFNDLDDPKLHHQYTGPTNAIDHNGYVKGNLFYLANYTAGVRIIDLQNIEEKALEEVGFFDTFPSNNNVGFGGGVWSVYPYLPSGNIILSDLDGGLFVIRKSGT